MIGQLHGILLEKQPPQLLLGVHGVGYEVEASMTTFYRLPELGQEVTLHTHLIVREDAHILCGFYTREERTLFRTLLKVNGVGPKLALTILSSVEPAEFVRCVQQHDTASLVRMPGVGKKTAERLVMEMQDKLKDWVMPLENSAKPVPISSAGARQQIIQDAVSALVSLGYKPQEASRMVGKADDGSLTSEHLIRRALREAV